MSRPTVFVSRKLPEAAMAIIRRTCEVTLWPEEERPVPPNELVARLREADGALLMLSDRIDGAVLDAAGPRCRVIANMAVGYDNIDIAACTQRGVLVTNTPGVLTDTTADLAFALLMAAARRLGEGQRLIQADRWTGWSPMFMVGQEITGATIGIVGAGRIGQAVAKRAAGFDMRLLYHNRKPSADMAALGAEYRGLDDLLRESDFVVVLLPLSAETRGLFGEREFRLMKPTAVFVNAARGPIVQEGALYRALQEGWIWAAGLDVFAAEPIRADHPLLSLDNVTAVPHIGSATVQTRTRMATLAAENLVAVVTGGRPITPVNPQVLDQ